MQLQMNKGHLQGIDHYMYVFMQRGSEKSGISGQRVQLHLNKDPMLEWKH